MSQSVTVQFRLYVAGDAPHGVEALANLTALCRECLPDRNAIEVIDVFKEPKRALDDGVFMTPLLVKQLPWPTQRIVGTLSQRAVVLRVLGLEAAAGAAS